MENYLSVKGQTVSEKVIEKSRFITCIRHVESELEAKAFIAEISSQHQFATHNCYACICDNLGNCLRFSDDGEPQGTAGMPMLEVLKNNKLYQVAVVVTRYFGGIKLGAGGLVRAYSGCAAQAVSEAEKVLYQNCVESLYSLDYASADAAARYFSESGANVLQTQYLNEVTFRVAVKSAAVQDFEKELKNRLNGKVKIEKLKEYFFPFKI